MIQSHLIYKIWHRILPAIKEIARELGTTEPSVVCYVFPDDPLYMPASKEEDMIQTFSTQTADEPFADPVRTRRSIWRLEFLDT